MNSTKAMGTFEVANARSSHIVTLHAVDDEAIQQEWEWGRIGDREGVRGVGDPRSPRVHVVPTGVIAEMIRDAVATDREASAEALRARASAAEDAGDFTRDCIDNARGMLAHEEG